MDIFSVFAILGGVAFFLFGMRVMSQSFEKLAEGRLTELLGKMTSSAARGVVLGTVMTAAVQSSSAVTVMLVGLVDSGVLSLGSSFGVVAGSNIGTTFTAWILSLSGLEGDSFVVKLLRPESFAPLLAFCGMVCVMFSGSERRRGIGMALMGFAVLCYGMEIMKNAVAPLSREETFRSLISFNPLMCLLAGAVFTGVIQSSSASVGILQAISTSGFLSLGVALPVILGQNIGTCVTALIAAVGVGKTAKRVAYAHVFFNVTGAVVCMILFSSVNFFFPDFFNSPASPFSIALAHSIFNIISAVVFVPLSGKLSPSPQR